MAITRKSKTRLTNQRRVQLALAIGMAGLLTAIFLLAFGDEQNDSNNYVRAAFPASVSTRVFNISLESSRLLIVIPAALEASKSTLERRLSEKCGESIPFRESTTLKADDLRGKDLILVGNIMNNSWLLELYMKRRAFADAYFPGPGGVLIHPAKSPWDISRNILVIGISREEDGEKGFSAFLDQITPGTKSLGPVHLLKTAHEIPRPPESVETTLGAVRKDSRERPDYRAIAQWGFLYFLTGERQWGILFRDAMEILRERAKKNGKWITEPWTNIYFSLWNIFGAWVLMDDDPFFRPEDRQIIEEVLWGFTRSIQARPYLDEDKCPLDEPRQNHSTFLALSLDAAYRYYTEKYGLKGLEPLAEKVKRCFDLGQAAAYRPNDDGGSGYLVLAPSHYLYYALSRQDFSFLQNGRLRTLVDLMVATIDNRSDPVTFGDIGSYSHRKPGEPQRPELQFFSLAAWFYKEGTYQWLFNWLTKDSRANFDPAGPLALGLYATDIEPAPPSPFLGIRPVLLDEACLRWVARRAEESCQLPSAERQYFDKISFRRSFDPEDEYLLLDGTSTFAHGHEDGNTVTRLTWKDRVWLADLHYIKAGPQEHNGVVIVRNGTQNPPPPLTELEQAAEFDTVGLTLTTTRNFNGADWQRYIFWSKGRYFLFLDRVLARKQGDYRLENRWRMRGDVKLQGNTITVRQGEKTFWIKSADSAPRLLQIVPDEHHGEWDYPYGSAATIVCLARKKTIMGSDSSWTFANLMGAGEGEAAAPQDLLRMDEDLYVIETAAGREFIGLCPKSLSALGISTDCSLFAQTPERLFLFNLTHLTWGEGYLVYPMGASLAIDRKNGSAILLVSKKGELIWQAFEFKGKNPIQSDGPARALLSPGRYELSLVRSRASFDRGIEDFYSGQAAKVFPEPMEPGPVDFGLEIGHRLETKDRMAAATFDGRTLFLGSEMGSVFKLEGDRMVPLFELPRPQKILTIAVADLDRDGQKEIITSDEDENLFCYRANGSLAWRVKTRKSFGPDANVTDLWVDDIDGKGTPTILAATNAWKLYAIRPDGSIRWESFIFYHPLTKVRVLKNKNQIFIGVGTVYQTPFNLVDPSSGAVLWKTWEQTGSETMSTTDYCGKHLRDMVFLDIDDDGKKEIVFGNESHSIYALEAADGKIRWKTQVGDKVSGLRLLRDGTGGEVRILVGTEAGEIYLFDRRQGKKLRSTSLDSAITGMEVIPGAAAGRDEVMLTTIDGRVAVMDSLLGLRASLRTGLSSILGLYPAEKSGRRQPFYVVAKKEILEGNYAPVYLRPSRHY